MSLSSIYRPHEDISNPSLDSVLAKLAVMNPDQLKAFAAEHQDDMVLLGAAQAVHAKHAEYAQKANAPQGGQMPPVNQQVVQGMDPMPQMPPQGGQGMPPQGGQGMPPQGMPPQMPPQGMPPQGGGQLPEQQGIAQLPAPNIQNMAGGGIVAFADGGYADDMLGADEPVLRMADGGYVPRYDDFGAVSAPFEDAFNTTLRYEGGFVKDDAGKGPSNFGINKTANPDVDVENLTKDKARDIYKKRYWDAIGGDTLAEKNPALAKVAFDTAVNMGVSKANKLVADSKGDPAALLSMRQQHYNNLLEKDPEKFSPYAKGWKSRLADLATSVIPSAGAAELPSNRPAAPAQPEKEGLAATDAGSNVLKGMVAGNVGINALQSAKDVLNAGFKPGTTAGQAGRVLGTAAAVPQAVMAGGVAATKKAMNDLQAMSPEQRREMSSNPMLSAMSGDAGLASAIMDAAANNPQGPSKMSYKDQMTNVGKLLVGHPDIERQRLASEAKKPAAQKKQVGYDPNNMVPISPDEFGSAVGIPEVPNKAVVEATKDTVPEKERKGFDYETLLTLGLGLMANKNPRFLTALGEAGLQALAGKKEREKAETDTEYKKSQTRQANAYADYIERGGKEKKMELEAEKLVQDHMEAWEKANKITSIQNPGARLQEETRARQQIYTNLGIKPIMAGQAAPASSGGFKFVGVS